MDLDIDTRLERALAPYATIKSKLDFIAACVCLPDALQDFFVLLAKSDVNELPALWFVVVGSFVQCSRSLATHVKQYQRISELAAAVTAATRTLLLILKYIESFFRVFRPPGLHGRFLSLASDAAQYVLDCVGVIDVAAFLGSLAAAVARFFEAAAAERVLDSAGRIEVCSLMVSICKAAFYGGCPGAVVLLVFSPPYCVSESFILPVVGHDALPLKTVVDYFRYSSYCLVSHAADLDTIDDRVTRRADIFFRVLLGLPCLLLSNYPLHLNKYGDFMTNLQAKLVSYAEREELAFFYLLNYLFKLTRLDALVDADRHRDAELRFFIDSFHNRIAFDLEELVSVPLSRSSSDVFMPRSAEPSDQGVPTAFALCSILSDGSYKERLRLVADFFALVYARTQLGSLLGLAETFDLSQLHAKLDLTALGPASEISSVVSRVDLAKFPGKQLYLMAVDKVVRLVLLLALKYVSLSTVVYLLPTDILARYFSCKYTLEQIVLVKPNVLLEGEQLRVCSLELSDDEMFRRLLKILERTEDLERSIQRLQ